MTKIMNAFHLDYIKTHHPEFLAVGRSEEKSKADIQEKKRKLLAMTEFYMFSKAGAANVTPKGRREKKEQVQA